MMMSPFDILNGMSKGKFFSKQDVESALNKHLLLSFLIGNRLTINLSEYLNESYNMKLYDMYLFVCMVYKRIPEGKRYTKYYKFQKEDKDEDVINNIRRYYICSKAVAQNYFYNNLSKEKIQYIESIYKEDK